MEVISIERSTYEELLTSFNSFITKMKEMASRGNDKGLDDWLMIGCFVFALIIAAAWIFQLVTLENPFK